MKKMFMFCASICLLASGASLLAQETKLVDLYHIYPEELENAGFELKSNQTVKIDAAGFWQERDDYEVNLVNAWILDAATRDVVWEMMPEKKDGLFRIETELSLPAGK